MKAAMRLQFTTIHTQLFVLRSGPYYDPNLGKAIEKRIIAFLQTFLALRWVKFLNIFIIDENLAFSTHWRFGSPLSGIKCNFYAAFLLCNIIILTVMFLLFILPSARPYQLS